MPQGEIIDQYLKEDHKSMIQISSCIQIGASVSAILSAALYVAGGWVLVGLGVASFNIIPIILIPFFRRIEVRKNCQCQRKFRARGGGKPPLVRNYSIVPDTMSTWQRTVAFYCSDVVLFLNNLVFELVAYVLPARFVQSETIALTAAVSMFHVCSVVSLLSALLLSFLAVRIKNFGILRTMAAGNVIYYGGVILAFGATTSFFRIQGTTTQLVVGLVLLGLGEPCHLNLCISSKFSLYEKWRLSNGGLGEQASRINNLALTLSSALGTVVSAVALTDQSGIPTVAAISGVCVLLTVGLIVCDWVR